MNDGTNALQNALAPQLSLNQKTGHTNRKNGLDQGRIDRRCSWCFSDKETVFVHGHEQCSTCGTNVVECCLGSYW